MKRKEPDMTHFSGKGWMKLDNAAKLYPAITSADLPSVFRITAELHDPVRYSALKTAVELTSQRFPYFSVTLGRGLFWYYLEFTGLPPRIQPGEKIPCTAFATGRKDEPLHRIIVSGKTISVEFIHILTDGSGALEYLKSLLATYLITAGKVKGPLEGIMLPGVSPAEEEYEDSYGKYFRKLPPIPKPPRAWQLPYRLRERPAFRVINAEVNVCELLTLARKHRVSVTEYFIAVYLLALQEIWLSSGRKDKKKINKVLRIEVPVDMRRKLPSRTMRNFSLFVEPELDIRLGTYNFEEIISSVHHQMQLYSDTRQISRFLSENVGYEKLLLIRALPLFVKRAAIAAIYRQKSSKGHSGVVTNLGQISLPEEMRSHVSAFGFIPPPPNKKVKTAVAFISYNDRMRISFGSVTESRELERLILSHFTREGVHVKILKS